MAMVTALWALARVEGFRTSEKDVPTHCHPGCQGRGQQTVAKAGKLLLDDTPIEKTGQQIEGSRVDS